MANTPPSAIKINTDAAWKLGNARLGIIERNHRGSVEFVASVFRPPTSSAEHAEFLAIREGVFAATCLQLQEIIIESDSQLAISRLENEGEDLSSLGLLASDIRGMLCLIPKYSFSWVKRCCNYPAHRLASVSFSTNVSRFWGSLPHLMY